MKKLVLFLLIGVLASTLFGCGSSSSTETPTPKVNAVRTPAVISVVTAQ